LNDSPVFLLAWLSTSSGTGPILIVPEEAIDRDTLLTNVMLYWLTGTAASSVRYYKDGLETWGEPEAPLTVPMAVAVFPRDNYIPIRRLPSNDTIARWTEFEQGGHFPGLAQPELLIADLRAACARISGETACRTASHRRLRLSRHRVQWRPGIPYVSRSRWMMARAADRHDDRTRLLGRAARPRRLASQERREPRTRLVRGSRDERYCSRNTQTEESAGSYSSVSVAVPASAARRPRRPPARRTVSPSGPSRHCGERRRASRERGRWFFRWVTGGWSLLRKDHGGLAAGAVYRSTHRRKLFQRLHVRHMHLIRWEASPVVR
jgi:hypothetical protein